MAVHIAVQLDPSPSDDPVVAQRTKAIDAYLAGYPVGDGDRLAFVSPQVRDSPAVYQAELDRLLPTAEFLITLRRPVTAEIIQLGRRLRLVQKLGVDAANLDLSAAAERGIPVALSPHLGVVSVAEHTLMLMLALSRQLIRMHRLTQAAANPEKLEPLFTTQWQRRFNWMGFPGEDFACLEGKTLGIVGLGEIASAVVQRARAFGMAVQYTKRHRLSPGQEQAMGVCFAPVDLLLQTSDYVSLHVTQTPQTEKMIGQRELGLMKRTAFLINTSRGNVIDQGALIHALQEGQIAGAGLDVYSVEPIRPDDPLLHLGNVVLTPHIAAYGPVLDRYTRAFENCKRVMEGLPPWDLVSITR